MNSIDLSANELDKVIQYFDYNGSGYIGYDNFADVLKAGLDQAEIHQLLGVLVYR